MLLATVSDTPRTNYDSVKDYFDSFLKMKPQGMCGRDLLLIDLKCRETHKYQTTQLSPGKIIEGKINVGEGWASDAGIYEVCSVFLQH